MWLTSNGIFIVYMAMNRNKRIFPYSCFPPKNATYINRKDKKYNSVHIYLEDSRKVLQMDWILRSQNLSSFLIRIRMPLAMNWALSFVYIIPWRDFR